MSNWFGRIALGSAMLLGSVSLAADTLWLHNGDRISGELVSVSGTKVKWRSPLLGELTVNQLKVSAIESSEPREVVINQHHYQACTFSAPEQRPQMQCADGVVEVDWREIGSALKPAADKEKSWDVSGSVAIAMRNSGGNTKEEQWAVDSRVEAIYGVTRQILTLEYDVESEDEVKTKDERKLNYQYDLFLTDKWYINSSLGWEENRFKDLDQRVIVGFGGGYQFLNTPISKLSAEAGINWIEESFIKDRDRERSVFRWKLNYSRLLSDSGLEFFHRHVYLLSLDDSEDWEVDSETGLKWPLMGNLRSEIKLEYDYDNRPSDDADELDRVWSVGVIYDW